VRNGVAVNLVIHLRWPVQLVYRLGCEHRFLPEADELWRRKLERLGDVPLRDNADVSGERGFNRRGDPSRFELCDDVERLAVRANRTVWLRTIHSLNVQRGSTDLTLSKVLRHLIFVGDVAYVEE
jgi:hypothetical protein